jgi:hypothetical protein
VTKHLDTLSARFEKQDVAKEWSDLLEGLEEMAIASDEEA